MRREGGYYLDSISCRRGAEGRRQPIGRREGGERRLRPWQKGKKSSAFPSGKGRRRASSSPVEPLIKIFVHTGINFLYSALVSDPFSLIFPREEKLRSMF